MDRSEKDRVKIFDTTLRDGEQSPGISLNKQEKLEIAHQLARLGVDVIEAGFPISSPGDFEAVQAIAREVHGPVICGLARANAQDVDAAWNAIKDSERPRIHTFISTSDIHIEHQLQSTREDVKGQARAAVAQARAHCDDVEFSPDGRHALRARVHCRGAADRARRGRHHDQRAGHGRLRDAGRVRRDVARAVPARARPGRRDHLGALPRRPRRGRGQLVRRREGGLPPGGVRDQRHRRAGGQRVARGDRDAASTCARRRTGCGPAWTRARSRARAAWCRA